MHSEAETKWLEMLGWLIKYTYKSSGRNGHHVITVKFDWGTEDNQESLRVAGILTHVLTGTSQIQAQLINSIKKLPNFQRWLIRTSYIYILVTVTQNPLMPELNPSAQRCWQDILLDILLLEPCTSLTYAWKTNKCNNYSFSLLIMYGTPTCFGITLPSSGCVPSAFWEMLNWGAVDRILWMGVLCLVT
jgi:hypothetical protein